MPPERPTPHCAASGTVAPTEPLPSVRDDAQDHRRSLQVRRWGLVPFWGKDINALLLILFLSDTHGGRTHDLRIAEATPYPLPVGVGCCRIWAS